MEGPPLLIRRDAQRKLSLAIAWFLAAPAFVLGLATIVWPIGGLAFGDCFNACPPPAEPTIVAPFLAPAVAALILVAAGALVLYRLTYRRAPVAWRIVAAIGVASVGAAVVVDAAARVPEAVIATVVWPMAPGLMAIDAARRGLHADRSPGSS